MDTRLHAGPAEKIKPIRTAADHRGALADVDRYFAQEPPVGTPDGDRFAVLLSLIAAYEEQHFPIAVLATPYRLENDAA